MSLDILNEAFKKLNMLNEEAFDISQEGIDDFSKFLEDGEKEPEVVDVIDVDAESEEDIKKSYIGNIIIECNICHTPVFKEEEEVVIDDSGIVCPDCECPYCGESGGFKIIGKIEPYDPAENAEEEKTEETEEKTEEEIVDGNVEIDGDEVSVDLTEDIDNHNDESTEDFLRNAVSDMRANESITLCRKYVGDNLVLAVYWADGFGKEGREDCIQSRQDPDYALCVAVKCRNDQEWDGLYLQYPRYADTDEVFDTEISIHPNEDFAKLAKDLDDTVASIKEKVASGELKECNEGFVNKSTYDAVVEQLKNGGYGLTESFAARKYIRTVSKKICESKGITAGQWFKYISEKYPQDIKFLKEDSATEPKNESLEESIPSEEELHAKLDQEFEESTVLGESLNEAKSSANIDDLLNHLDDEFEASTTLGESLNEDNDGFDSMQPKLDKAFEIGQNVLLLTEPGRGTEYKVKDWASRNGVHLWYISGPTVTDEDDFEEVFEKIQSDKAGKKAVLVSEINRVKPQLRGKLLDGIDGVFTLATMKDYKNATPLDRSELERFVKINLTKDDLGESLNEDNSELVDRILAHLDDEFEPVTVIGESLEKVAVSTEDQELTVRSDEGGKVVVETQPRSQEFSDDEDIGEMIAPLDDAEKDELIASEEVTPEEEEESEEEVVAEDEEATDEEATDEEDIEKLINATKEENDEEETVDVDVDEIKEESFNSLGKKYLMNIYENVQDFRTTGVKEQNDSLIVEGVIKFKSGNEKPTKFVFESISITPSGRVRLIGENLQLSKGKKSFSINGRLDNKVLIAESLTYNYKTKNANGESVKVSGTVSNK